MDHKDAHNIWLEGYNDGYRRAIESVKEYPEMDTSKLVEKMMSDWYNS